jgi:hypothetical protein
MRDLERLRPDPVEAVRVATSVDGHTPSFSDVSVALPIIVASLLAR